MDASAIARNHGQGLFANKKSNAKMAQIISHVNMVVKSLGK